MLLTLLFISNANAQEYVLSEKGSRLQTQIYTSIRNGISDQSEAQHISYSVENLATVLSSLNDEVVEGTKVIILGGDPANIERTIRDVAPNLEATYGAHTLSRVDDINGISLLVNPTQLLSSIKKRKDSISKVRTVVTDSYDVSYLEEFSRIAKELDIAFEWNVVSDAVGLAQEWQSILDDVEPAVEAIALLDTKYMDEIKGLRFILNSSWEKKLNVITTIPSYTPRGVGFGVAHSLPDYGMKLLELSRSGTTELIYTDSYRPVLSVRTLSHNGIRVNATQDIDNAVLIE